MFKKILIANRGEIACRVIKTARKMGIKTVAVYSDADAGARHVEMADEAVHIGPPPAAESYLAMDKILGAIKETGAEAVHPGYGFLSENQEFAKALEKAGVAFIGPGIKAIAAMGDKIESKKLAADAKVSTVPGHMDLIKDAKHAEKIAGQIGYPVMIKASAGGGGKGMRIAWNEGEVADGFRSAKNEAKSSFGDDRIFIEKFIEEPRHIEIQILADGQGTTLYLGERECSIQRRNQKVIEEAPSTFLDEKTRKAMGEQSVALAEAVDYKSAGTVEFIVDKERNFYFLEMNTRLQVEHPVTEYVTGIDLVEQMIRVAAGEKLKLKQKDIKLDGWSIEARVYAEDPFRNFLPSIGRLVRYRPPESSDNENVRVDTGVGEGDEISMFYDPMIAKLVTWGKDREAATAEMRRALDAFYIRGVGHNISFLAALMAHPRFVSGKLTTNFIAEEYPDGFLGGELLEEDRRTLIAVAATIQARQRLRDTLISGQIEGHEARARRKFVVVLDREQTPVKVKPKAGGANVEVGGDTLRIRSDWQPGMPLFQGEIDGAPVSVQVDRAGPGWKLFHAGAEVEALVVSPRTADLYALMPVKEPPDTSQFLLSPMPGLLVSVAVESGQSIKAGEELAVVEAMKMENILRADRDGTIAKLHAKPGDSLTVDQAILEFETG